MDFNFPLILVILVAISGLISLIDKLFLAKARNARAADQTQANGDSEAQKESAKEPVIIEYANSFFPVLLLVLVIRSFLVEPFQIPSSSMVPTLQIGDFILVNKFSYGIRLPVIRTKVIDVSDPKKGDVMVFFPPHDSNYFIKRVIGEPGDTITYTNNQLYVNGEAVVTELQARLPAFRPAFELHSESLGDVTHLIHKNIRHDVSLFNPEYINNYVVPEGHYYMMGDNRNNSSDSRVWGAVSEDNIVGKAFAIWMHWDGLPSFSRVGAIQ